MQDKPASSEDGTQLSVATVVPEQPTYQRSFEYPVWITDIFTLMTATYGTLWTDQFLDEKTSEAIRRVWFFQLKEFPVHIIRQGILQAGKIYKYPPKPSEMIELMRNIQRREKDKLDFKRQDELRMLPAPVRNISSRTILEEKLKMWHRLNRLDRVKEVENQLLGLSENER